MKTAVDASVARALQHAVRRKVARPLFATLAGEHLRGLARRRAPCRVSGAMVLPLRDVLGLRPALETKERQVDAAGHDVTLVFHDVRNYLDRVARTGNTAVLEELFSPHVVLAGRDHERLKTIARGFINRSCYHDYLDRAHACRRRVEESPNAPVRDVLESARLCLAGAQLMDAHEIESDLPTLLDLRDAHWLKPFLRRHLERGSEATLDAEERRLLAYELDRLEDEMAAAHARSSLSEAVGSISMLDEVIVELRLRDLQGT